MTADSVLVHGGTVTLHSATRGRYSLMTLVHTGHPWPPVSSVSLLCMHQMNNPARMDTAKFSQISQIRVHKGYVIMVYQITDDENCL